MMFHCVSTGCKKLTTLVGTLIMGQAMDTWGQEGYAKLLNLLFSIAVNVKLLFKKCIKN